MDPLAHTLIGATLAETRLRNGTAALAAPAGVLAANAPDMDAVTMFISRDLSLGFRRGWTHGVLAMVVLPLVLTAALLLLDRVVARWRGRAPAARAGPLLRLTSVAVLSHPALDWLNTYGVRFLMPFDDTWFYGDALFIIDPWVWLLGGLTVVLAHSATWAGGVGWVLLAGAATLVTGTVIGFGRFADTPPATALAWGAGLAAIVWMRVTWGGRGRLPHVAAACLAAVALYAGGMAAASLAAERQMGALLARQAGAAPVEVLAIPVPGNPFRRGIVAVYPRRLPLLRARLAGLAAPAADRRPRPPRPRGAHRRGGPDRPPRVGHGRVEAVPRLHRQGDGRRVPRLDRGHALHPPLHRRPRRRGGQAGPRAPRALVVCLRNGFTSPHVTDKTAKPAFFGRRLNAAVSDPRKLNPVTLFLWTHH